MLLHFLISLISLNSDVAGTDDDRNSMFELNFLIFLNSAVIESIGSTS